MQGNDEEIITEIISIGGLSVNLLRYADIDRLFDQLVSKDGDDEAVTDERIPYWAELWPSATGLARHLASKPELVRHKHVLEIGCGLALPGIVAGMIGAKVTLSDYLPEAVEFARRNWKQNFQSEANALMLDWRSPPVDLTCDVLIASDIAYESRSFLPLINAFRKLVRPGGQIIVSEPNRSYAKAFFDSLAVEGFSFESYELIIPSPDVDYIIRIHEITR